MAPMKIARRDFACCRVGNLVYVVGGEIDPNKTSSVEIYNLDTDSWSFGTDLPVPGSFEYACAVSNKINGEYWSNKINY